MNEELNTLIKNRFGVDGELNDRILFLVRMALSASIASAIRHQEFYLKSTNKPEIRQKWMKLLIDHSQKEFFSIEEYVCDVSELTEELKLATNNNANVKLSFAQKSLSVFLKYLWCYGIIETVPACPIDYVVLSKAKDIDSTISIKNWTALDDKEEYLKILRALKKWKEEGKSIAEKELKYWNHK